MFLRVVIQPVLKHALHVSLELIHDRVLSRLELFLYLVDVQLAVRGWTGGSTTLRSLVLHSRKDVTLVMVFDLLESIPRQIKPLGRLRRRKRSMHVP